MTENSLTIDNDRENARVGYQVAVELWKLEREQNFARFNVMLLANSIIVSVIALILTSQFSSSVSRVAQIFMPSLIVFLSVMGIVLCIMSSLILIRGFEYQNYYITSAREIEEKYLSLTIKTVSGGQRFEKGDYVLFDLEDPPKLRMGQWARLTSMQPPLQIILGFFVGLYSLFILYSPILGFLRSVCH